MEAKYNRKISVDKIKRLASSKADPANYDSNAYARIPHKKNVSNGFLRAHKQWYKKTINNSGSQHYCILFNKSGLPDNKRKLRSSKKYFGKRSYQVSIKGGLGYTLDNRAADVKQYHKSKKKLKMKLEATKKQNKMIFSMDNHFCSFR